MEDLKQSVLDVLRSALEEPDLPEDAALGQTPHWDSLKHVKCLMAIEMKFGVKIGTYCIAELTSVDKIVDFLKSTRSETA